MSTLNDTCTIFVKCTWFSGIGYSQQSAQFSIGHFNIRHFILIENDLQLLNPEDEVTIPLRNNRNYLLVSMP
jgi:hypothetical protein